MLIMNAVIHFSTPPLFKRDARRNSHRRENEWAQPSRSCFGLHLAVYIRAWFSRRTFWDSSFSTCREPLTWDHRCPPSHMKYARLRRANARITEQKTFRVCQKMFRSSLETLETRCICAHRPHSSWSETDFCFWFRSPFPRSTGPGSTLRPRPSGRGRPHAPKIVWCLSGLVWPEAAPAGPGWVSQLVSLWRRACRLHLLVSDSDGPAAPWIRRSPWNCPLLSLFRSRKTRLSRHFLLLLSNGPSRNPEDTKQKQPQNKAAEGTLEHSPQLRCRVFRLAATVTSLQVNIHCVNILLFPILQIYYL